MGFKEILERVQRIDEELYLMKYELGEKDELGFPEKKFIEIQKLNGVIQREQISETGIKGVESEPHYTGYFLPEFTINIKELNDYRIKYNTPNESFLYQIVEYNPNLFLRKERDHIALRLLIDKKNNAI